MTTFYEEHFTTWMSLKISAWKQNLYQEIQSFLLTLLPHNFTLYNKTSCDSQCFKYDCNPTYGGQKKVCSYYTTLVEQLKLKFLSCLSLLIWKGTLFTEATFKFSFLFPDLERKLLLDCHINKNYQKWRDFLSATELCGHANTQCCSRRCLECLKDIFVNCS